MNMRMELGIGMKQSQQMILAPRMIQSMEILQLPIMALQERIQQELEENPVLELTESANDAAAPESDGQAATEVDATVPESEPVVEAAAESDPELDRLEAFTRDWEDQINEE